MVRTQRSVVEECTYLKGKQIPIYYGELSAIEKDLESQKVGKEAGNEDKG